MESHDIKLENVVKMGDQLSELFEQGKIEQMIELTVKRQTMLESIFESPISANNAEQVKRKIELILERDNELKDQVLQSQKSAIGELLQLKRSKNATKSYQSVKDNSC